MEHRYSTRFPVNVPVIIFYRKQPIAWGITRDVSSTGMYVRAVTPRAIDQNLVEICWPYANQTRSLPLELTSRGIRARVVRYRTDGLGLSIENRTAGHEQAIQALVAAAGQPYHLQGHLA